MKKDLETELEVWEFLAKEFALPQADREYQVLWMCDTVDKLYADKRITLKLAKTVADHLTAAVKARGRSIWLYDIVYNGGPDISRARFARKQVKQLTQQ